MLLLEGVGDVLQEDQAEDDVLVLGRVHVAPQLVGRLPELLRELPPWTVVGGFCLLKPCRHAFRRSSWSVRFRGVTLLKSTARHFNQG